jgi:hypothetical protein
MLRRSCTLVASLAILSQCAASPQPLPLCPGDQPSPVYRLSVDGREIPTAFTRFNGDAAFHVAAVEIDEPQRIVLSAPTAALDRLTIRPKRFAVEIQRRADAVSFILKPNQKLVLESPQQRPLLLFALPREKRPPDPDDPGVVYFGPGEHDAGLIRLRSGQELYLAAGARVKGRIYALEARDLSIRGRGVLDARGFTDCDRRINGILFERCQNISIEGVQLRTGDWWQSLFLLCDDVRIEHLHTLSFGKNNDGVDIDGVANFRIADSFIGCGDDGFGWHALDAAAFGEPPTRNCRAERCVIWNQFDGNGLRIGASMETGLFEDVVFRDIDLLHASRNAVMSDHSDWATVRNLRFEQFHNDTSVPLARMIIAKNNYSNLTGYRDSRGRIQRVVFRDCSTSGEGAFLEGADPDHEISGVRFQGCRRNRRPFSPSDVRMGPYVQDVAFDDSPFATPQIVAGGETDGPQASAPAELVMDDEDEGTWAYAAVGLQKQPCQDAVGGEAWVFDGLGWGRAAVFMPRIQGRYEVSVHWGTHHGLATKAPWTVRHQDGYSTSVLDQNDSPGWKSLGAFELNEASWVRLADPHDQISNGAVVADAVRFRRTGYPRSER